MPSLQVEVYRDCGLVRLVSNTKDEFLLVHIQFETAIGGMSPFLAYCKPELNDSEILSHFFVCICICGLCPANFVNFFVCSSSWWFQWLQQVDPKYTIYTLLDPNVLGQSEFLNKPVLWKLHLNPRNAILHSKFVNSELISLGIVCSDQVGPTCIARPLYLLVDPGDGDSVDSVGVVIIVPVVIKLYVKHDDIVRWRRIGGASHNGKEGCI